MSSSTGIDLSGPVYCVVTGASQGIGRYLALEFSKNFGSGSKILLIARNEEGLQETASLCQKYQVDARVKALDLQTATPKAMFDAIQQSLQGSVIEDFSQFIIIHNVGSIGDLSEYSSEMQINSKMVDYFNLNVFNVITLNTQFMKIFSNFNSRIIIINITSLCAIKPMTGMAYYCSGKAAREMYFKVLAEDIPEVRVLNYSPGPVETAMVDYVVDNAVNQKLKDVFHSFKEQNILLKPEVTAAKCVDVLKYGKFTNGQHADYFDE